MKTQLMTAAAVLLLLSAPALAEECLDAIEKIDAALASEERIAEEPKAQVIKLRQSGEKLHTDGRHDRAARRFKMAMRIFDQAVAEAKSEASEE